MTLPQVKHRIGMIMIRLDFDCRNPTRRNFSEKTDELIFLNHECVFQRDFYPVCYLYTFFSIEMNIETTLPFPIYLLSYLRHCPYYDNINQTLLFFLFYAMKYQLPFEEIKICRKQKPLPKYGPNPNWCAL